MSGLLPFKRAGDKQPLVDEQTQPTKAEYDDPSIGHGNGPISQGAQSQLYKADHLSSSFSSPSAYEDSDSAPSRESQLLPTEPLEEPTSSLSLLQRPPPSSAQLISPDASLLDDPLSAPQRQPSVEDSLRDSHPPSSAAPCPESGADPKGVLASSPHVGARDRKGVPSPSRTDNSSTVHGKETELGNLATDQNCVPSPPWPSRPPSSHLTSRPVSPENGDAWSQASPSDCEDTARLLPSAKKPRSQINSPGGTAYKTFPTTTVMETNGKSPYTSKDEIFQSGSGTQPKKSGNTFFVWFLSCFATLGGLLFGYDTGIVSGAMLKIQPDLDLNTVWTEGIVSGTIGAAAIFALFAGFVCDLIGRKKTIMTASFIFAVGAIVMGAAPDKEGLLAGRIIVGMGIGFASMTVPIYVAEVAPADIRGRLVTLNQLFITIGILLSSIIAGAFSYMDQSKGWRYMLGLASVPGVIQFLGFFYLPESPRWLVSKKREDDARRVLRRIRGYEDVEVELAEVIQAEDNKQTGFVLTEILSTPHVRKALFVGCGLQLFQQLCGINTVIYYSATILKNAGFPPDQAIWLVCVPFAVNFLATFIGLWAVERLGRRILLIISFLGVIVALIVLAVGFLLSAKYSPAINGNMTIEYFNGTKVMDECQQYTICEDCILNDKCGYCHDENDGGASTCLLALDDDEDLYSTYGRCDKNGTGITAGSNIKWAHGYCPTDYTWMAVLGLALFVLSFAPGLGPMPWTINSEIYPMWARGTGVAIATTFNWAFNLVVSFSFLTMLENITKYGTFFLFMGICILGLLFVLVFIPETKNLTLEEVEELFMTPERREQRQRDRQEALKNIGVDNPDPDSTRL